VRVRVDSACVHMRSSDRPVAGGGDGIGSGQDECRSRDP